MVYAKDFEPVCKVGENIKLSDGTVAVVEFIEPVPLITKDFGSLSAGASSTLTELDTELEVEKNQLLQIRIVPLDDIEVTVKQPRGVGKYSTRYTSSALKLLPKDVFQHSQESEIFIKEEGVIYVEVKNPTEYTLPRSKVAFLGYKYILKKYPPEQAARITKYTWVPTFGSGKYSS
ncbi:hypothetical protein DRN58_10100 [Thermococci archaeon]|nr:MAG: hypothetical protein DRN58_10100 [Thermococci archaeon]RLI51845.1 MAG: hypothetical protein DRP09_18800 [Candidatus Thorarchaeota archaeon]